MPDRKAKIRTQIGKLKKECRKLTGHDLNGRKMTQIGQSWFRYKQGSGYQQRFENCLAVCYYCGFIAIAHRANDDIVGTTLDWNPGESGGSLY